MVISLMPSLIGKCAQNSETRLLAGPGCGRTAYHSRETLEGVPEGKVGESLVPLLSNLSTSLSNCLTHLSATSALDPLYLAPLLSWVLVQMTSPSGSRESYGNLGSFTVSVFSDESLVAI
jgi:hypothetical protein